MKLITQLAALLFSIVIITPVNAADQEPHQMLNVAADNIIKFVEQNKDKLADDPSISVNLVKQELLPFIDQDGMGRRVIGKVWKETSAEMQQAFVTEFINLVIDTYAKGLAQYSGQTFTFQETEYNSRKTAARVQSVMNQPEGEPIKIDYLLRKMKDTGEFRVVDVTIEGVSMTTSYRNQFAPQIEQDGLQSIIDKLKSKEISLEQ